MWYLNTVAHVSSTIFIRFTSNFTRNLPFCIMHGSRNFSTKNETFCSRAYSLQKYQHSFKDPAYSSGKCHVETRNMCSYSSVETAGFVIYMPPRTIPAALIRSQSNHLTKEEKRRKIHDYFLRLVSRRLYSKFFFNFIRLQDELARDGRNFNQLKVILRWDFLHGEPLKIKSTDRD